MKVKLAAQTLSHTVAAGMMAKISEGTLNPEAVATAGVISNMDKLFDSVNSDSPDLRRGKIHATNLKPTTPHLQLFKDMKLFFNTLKFVGCTRTPPSKEGWISKFVSRNFYSTQGAMITAVNDFLDDLRGGKMTEAPIVKVEQGALQGRVANSPSGRAFYSFQGVPYAKPPLGSLRFKAPQPPEPWDDVRDATSEGNICAQIDPITKGYAGDENCLFLNIYTPDLEGHSLPVMVFIHGGGFLFGSGSATMYGGDYLVERDVVVVTANYRCGALGFLALDTPEVPGNAGLKDMALALRWVQSNIGNFAAGTRPTPLTRNLISKAIIQSGTALSSWALQTQPLEHARTLAGSLGCEANSVDEILEFLSTTPVKDIVEATSQLQTVERFYEQGSNYFAPVVEKEFPGVEAALTESFIGLLTSGRLADIPVMIGSTALEFAKERQGDLQAYIPRELHLKRDSEESLAVAEGIERVYFKGAEDNALERQRLLSDVLVNVDTHRYVQYLVKATNRPIYYYKFDYVGALNLSKRLGDGQESEYAAHLDELGYLFKNDYQKDVEPTAQDVKMRERMLRLWTNFAKIGNPTPDENHYLKVTWLPVTKDKLYYLKLGGELSLETSPDKERMDFWDEVYEKHFKIWDQPRISAEAQTRVEVVDFVKHETSSSTVETKETLIETFEQIVVSSEDSPSEQPEPVPELPAAPEPQSPPELPAAPEPQSPPELPDAPEPPTVPELPAVPEPVAAVPASNGVKEPHVNGLEQKKPRTSNEIKMVQQSNGHPKDVIRANDPPEDDLPKNIGVNKFVNFFESLGGKK
ncbi:unnamed protein product, partial [Iphiclides podalirius]